MHERDAEETGEAEESTLGPLHSLSFRLTYADTDPAGILYFAAWFPWMERAQSEWFYRQGLRHDRLMERHGFATVTRHTEAEYLVRVGLFDRIRLDLHLGEVRRASFVLQHRMYRAGDEGPAGAGEVLAGRGSITVVTVGPDDSAVPIPPVMADHLGAWREGRALTDRPDP